MIANPPCLATEPHPEMVRESPVARTDSMLPGRTQIGVNREFNPDARALDCDLIDRVMRKITNLATS
jgi:hypothetical protein